MQNLNKFLKSRYNFFYIFVFIFVILTLLNLLSIIQPFYADERPLVWAMDYSTLLKQVTNNYYLGIHNASAGFIFQLIFTPIFNLFNFNSTFIHIICTLFSSISIAALLKTLFEEIDLKKFLYSTLILFSSAQLLINFSLLRHEVFVLNTFFLALYAIKSNKTPLKICTFLLLALSYKFGVILIFALLIINIDSYLLTKKIKISENIILFILILLWSFIYIFSYKKYGYFSLEYSEFESITTSYLKDLFEVLNKVFLKDGRFVLSTFFIYFLLSKKINLTFDQINKLFLVTFILSLILIPIFNFDQKNMYLPLSLYFILFVRLISRDELKLYILVLFFLFSLSYSYVTHEIFSSRSHAYLEEVKSLRSLIQKSPKNKVILTNFPISLYLNFPEYNYVNKRRITKQIQNINSCPESDKALLITNIFSRKIINKQIDCDQIKTLKLNKFNFYFKD